MHRQQKDPEERVAEWTIILVVLLGAISFLVWLLTNFEVNHE